MTGLMIKISYLETFNKIVNIARDHMIQRHKKMNISGGEIDWWGIDVEIWKWILLEKVQLSKMNISEIGKMYFTFNNLVWHPRTKISRSISHHHYRHSLKCGDRIITNGDMIIYDNIILKGKQFIITNPNIHTMF